MTLHGVDWSNHQAATIKPAANDRFVFILTSDGHSWETPKDAAGVTVHDRQVAIVRKANRVVGHYHWLRPGNIAAQVAWFLKCAKPHAGDVLCVDWEQSGTTNRDKDQFIKRLQSAAPSNRVLLYCNTNYWLNYDKTGVVGDGLWIAEYDVPKPGIKSPWLFWQYTDKPIDQDRANFPTVASMKAWASKKPVLVPTPTPAQTAVAAVDGIPLGTYLASGTKIKWRALYHNNNVQANSTCYCVTQAIAVAEARLKKLGVIKNCLDFWQFGYGQAAAASADTHAAGGVVDTVQTDPVTQKVLREVGFTAAWERGPSTKLGNFSTHHIHAVLSGCPHVSAGAKAQIAQVRNGQNGLANHAADYGPKVPYTTWKAAFKKYVTKVTPIPVVAPAPAPIDQEELDMATQQPVKHRSKSIVVKPTKNGEHKVLYLDDKGNVSWAFGAGKYEANFYLRVSGDLAASVAVVNTKAGTDTVVSTSYPLPNVSVPKSDSAGYRVVPVRLNLGPAPKGQTRRLRLAVQNSSGKNVTVTDIYTYVWKA